MFSWRCHSCRQSEKKFGSIAPVTSQRKVSSPRQRMKEGKNIIMDLLDYHLSEQESYDSSSGMEYCPDTRTFIGGWDMSRRVCNKKWHSIDNQIVSLQEVFGLRRTVMCELRYVGTEWFRWMHCKNRNVRLCTRIWVIKILLADGDLKCYF